MQHLCPVCATGHRRPPSRATRTRSHFPATPDSLPTTQLCVCVSSNPHTTCRCSSGLTAANSTSRAAAAAPPPPPPPAPRVTRVFISQAGSKAEQTSQQLQQLAGTPPKSPASLTVKEQRERAELRVDRDKKKLEMMQQRIREDEQTLSELKRVEGERGGESDAVRLVFPTPDGPRM